MQEICPEAQYIELNRFGNRCREATSGDIRAAIAWNT